MSEIEEPRPGPALALAEYTPGSVAVLSDDERWPTMDAGGRARLQRWRRHPHAPNWVHATGDRLSAEQVERTRHPLPTEGWLDEHLGVARRLLRYRHSPGLHSLEDFPLIGRSDLVGDLAAFVPLDADLERMVHGSSSGSTGAALLIPDDIEEVARGFHLLVALAAQAGVDWIPEGERFALLHTVNQRQAFTYVSLVSSFAHRAMARVNLHSSSWPGPTARAAFLADADPQVVTGNPTSLAELLAADIRPHLRPRAVFSGAMALSAPLRARLEDAFDCPVFDIYGLHETRPIAVRLDDGPFRVLDRRVMVEVVDADGVPVPGGVNGEIVVTAGENPLLPLVRYRTGDFGRLVEMPGGGLGIADLEGREHTVFTAASGAPVPCVDLTQQLQSAGALGWAIEQASNGTIAARIAGGDVDAVEAALRALLAQPVTVARVEHLTDLGEGKPRRYRSAVPR